MKRIFAVSDVHGHATLLQEALEEAGFVSGSSEHLLVSCGDHFDRGGENRRVMELLQSIPNKVLLRGNHEDQLMDVLDRGYLTETNVTNGLYDTLAEFFGRDCVDREGKLQLCPQIEGELRGFVGEMADYWQTEHFVFTHGWLPIKKSVVRETVDPAWQWARRESWKRARFDAWHEQYSKGLLLPQRTVVCGHRRCSYGYLFDPRRSPADPSIFFGEGVVAIDACTVLSKQVNVLTVEDELCGSSVSMHLDEAPFAAIRSGEKTVELRLWDEKRKALQIGDEIRFTRDDGEEISVRVTGLNAYADFEQLMEEFSPREVGSSGQTKAQAAKAMEAYYSPDRVKKHGVLAIRFVTQRPF